MLLVGARLQAGVGTGKRKFVGQGLVDRGGVRAIEPVPARLVAHQAHELIVAEIAIAQPGFKLRRRLEPHALAKSARGVLKFGQGWLHAGIVGDAPRECAHGRVAPKPLVERGVEAQLIEDAIARGRGDDGKIFNSASAILTFDGIPQDRVLEDV